MYYFLPLGLLEGLQGPVGFYVVRWVGSVRRGALSRKGLLPSDDNDGSTFLVALQLMLTSNCL